MENKKNNIVLILVLIVLAGLSRLLPHPPNFSPVVAMAMFGGAYLMNKKYAIIIPLAMLFFSDLILNNTALGYVIDPNSLTFVSSYAIWVYLPMIAIAVIGMKMSKKVNIKSVVGFTLISSVLFFIISNFGSFLSLPMYTKDVNGLVSAYVNGIPFFRNALIGNMVYSIVLFGIYEWSQNRSLTFFLKPATV